MEQPLGTPAPVVFGDGVMVARDKQDHLILSRLQKGRFSPLTVPADRVSPWPIALAATSSHAYWVSNERLVRRQITADGEGPLEVLASDAGPRGLVDSARSSGATERDVVVYVGRPQSEGGEQSARLWVEGHGSRPVSREAGGATSVSIASLGAGRFALFTLDGRVGMSPIHSVSLELDADGAPHLGEDRVVYVTGTAERGSTLSGVRLGRGSLVLLPISKDERKFGLLMLRVGYGDGETPATWLDYPNGMDPAPVATGYMCGNPAAAFVRPSSDAAHAPSVLELATFDADGLIRSRRFVASSQKMPHIALRGDLAGAWLAYATDQGLRAQRVACK